MFRRVANGLLTFSQILCLAGKAKKMQLGFTWTARFGDIG
jgi:hypothetical protein